MAKLDRVYMTANQDANARLLALQSGDADIIYSLSLESLDALHKNPKLVIENFVIVDKKFLRVFRVLESPI